MIKIGIVGLGRMGVSHYAISNAHPGAEVASVCEPSAFVRGAVEKHTNVPCFKNLDDMFKSVSLDALFITTPTRMHYEITRKAVESGLHVFVEKPFCLTAEEGLELVDLAAQKKVINQVGYHNRFIGTFMEARRLVDSGELGEIYHILGEVYGPVVLKESKQTWRTDSAKGGGCLYDYATHIVNLLQYIIGPPENVLTSVLQSIYSRGVDDAVFATMSYGNGASGQLRANWSDETYRKLSVQVTIFGKLGKIRADSQELHAYFRKQPKDDSYESGWNVKYLTDLSPEVGYYLRGEEYSAQIEYFLDCIKKNNLDNINSFVEAQMTDATISRIKSASFKN